MDLVQRLQRDRREHSAWLRLRGHPDRHLRDLGDRTYDLADLPVIAVVGDDVTGDLYAGTDFGVMRLASGATTWTTTDGMPAAELAGLTIVPNARVLYAATHGLGAWAMDLGKLK